MGSQLDFETTLTSQPILQNLKELFGKKLGASDGNIGHVEDFYFDDNTWAVRFVVANTGSWLTGRLVLLAPHAFGQLHSDGHALQVNVTRKLIENAPSIKSNKPVSRQYEEEYYSYYGWPAYWEGGSLEGAAGTLSSSKQNSGHRSHNPRDDIHLRSAKAVIGYSVWAADEDLGLVESLMLDEKTWSIRQLVVEKGHLFSTREKIIPISLVERISFEESKVYVDFSTAAPDKAIQTPSKRAHAKHRAVTIKKHPHSHPTSQ